MGGLSAARRRAYAYLSRVLEPGSIPVSLWLTGTDVEQAADAVRTRMAPEDVLLASEARYRTADPDADLEAAELVGARLVTPECDEWPHFALAPVYAAALRRGHGWQHGNRRARLGGEVTPPLALWVRGRAPLADAATRSVAIVGSRASTAYGEHVAAELAGAVTERGVVVVSGGAFGIDVAAHRGALAAGGPTWIVTAGGVNRPYPTRHGPLFERVLRDGLVVSEQPPGSAPLRHRFLMRNRLIAALSSATVVVEAALRSGALNTVGHAQAIGRPVLAVPGPVTSPMSAGCHALLRRAAGPDGARVELAASAADVLAALDATPAGPDLFPADPEPAGEPGADPGGGPDGAPGGSPAERLRARLDVLPAGVRQVFDGLPRRGWATEAQIAARTGVSALDVARAVPALQLAGLVQSGPLGHRVPSGVLR